MNSRTYSQETELFTADGSLSLEFIRHLPEAKLLEVRSAIDQALKNCRPLEKARQKAKADTRRLVRLAAAGLY